MARAKKTKKFTEDEIIAAYMAYAVKSTEQPILEDFCLDNHIGTENFVQFFDSIQEIEKMIWIKLMERTLVTIHHDELFKNYKEQDKVLALFYTFFENLNLNRAYLIQNLEVNSTIRQKRNLLLGMKSMLINYVNEVFKDNRLEFNQKIVNKVNDIRKKSIGEGFWVQLKFLISFWRSDESNNFEKTDAAIEKSVQVAMDLMDTSRIKHIIDLGKFIWSEKVHRSEN